MSDYAYSTTAETASAIANKEVSSRELLDAALERVARVDGPVNAVVALDEDRARAAADEADKARAAGTVGPPTGLPITPKAVSNVPAGMPFRLKLTISQS